MVEISKRLKKHFLDLLNRDNYMNQSALNHLQQRPTVESMNDPHTLEGVKASISKLNVGEFARNHDIFAEVIWYIGDHLSRIILNIWNVKSVPKNW